MEPTDDLDDADVVVLNTCCIRENADNKLYGHLGHLKALKDGRPDLQIAVGRLPGPEGPRRSSSGPPTSTSCSAPTTSTGAASCSSGPGSRARSSRSSRSTTAYPVGAAGPARRRPRGVGSPSRSAATTRAPSASSRRCAGPRSAAAWATSSTRSRRSPPTASPRSPCSARTSTPTAATSAPAAVPPAVRRPAARGRRRRRHRAGPLHVAPSQGPAPRDDRGHGRDRRRCASTSTCPCRPAATGPWPACTAATPPSATSSGCRRPRAIPDLAVTTDLIVGFPGRDRRRLRAHPRGGRRGAYDAAYTFIFSPRPAPRPPTRSTTSSPASRAERFERLTGRGRAHAPCHATRPGRPSRGGLVEGPSKKDAGCSPAAPARTSSCTSGPEVAGAAPWPTSTSPGPRPTTCAATSWTSRPAPPPPAHPRRAPLPVAGP